MAAELGAERDLREGQVDGCCVLGGTTEGNAEPAGGQGPTSNFAGFLVGSPH